MPHPPLRRLLANATLVTPDGVLTGSALLIENGRIAALGPTAALADVTTELEVIDLQGAYVLPGLIDLHTDTLEKEITPRPAADFPIDIAVHELDRKLVACGITTVYHSLHLGYEEAEKSAASRFSRREIIAGVRAMAAQHTLAKTRIHLRYEFVGAGINARDLVRTLVQENAVDLLSFMDHTPGQGQYAPQLYLERQKKQGRSEAEALSMLAERQARPRLSFAELRDIAQLAIALGIPVASHDDCTAEKVRRMHDLGATVCEFPINLVAAETARSLGLEVLGGASNVLRGGSLTGNLDVTEGIRAGAVNGLCSDYYPPAMLHAVFKLWRERVLPLPEAVNTATLVPARAAGVDDETGSLVAGKDADLVVIRLRGETPVVEQTYVRGERLHMAGREKRRTPAELVA